MVQLSIMLQVKQKSHEGCIGRREYKRMIKAQQLPEREQVNSYARFVKMKEN
jgi:hypothetical protein